MSKRNLVIIKHADSPNKYLFEVPEGEMVFAGNYVTVDTARGKGQIGICMCDSFHADTEAICEHFGTTEAKLRPVTARLIAVPFIQQDPLLRAKVFVGFDEEPRTTIYEDNH